MNRWVILSISLLVGSAAPTAIHKSDVVVVTEKFYLDELVKYTGKHDIINICVPLSIYNFNSQHSLFFVEADIDSTGKKDYKGLYILKNGTATKLLDNGRDAAASCGDTIDVCFAAADGLYNYNAEKNVAEKYGTLTDNFISIDKNCFDGVLYVVNDKYEMFKVTESGTKKEKIQEVKSAKQVLLDYAENIYYIGEDKAVYVISTSLTKVNGLPENPSYVELIKPPLVFYDSILLVVDDKEYRAYHNGTSKPTQFEFKVRPTAYLETFLFQHYAHNKKIYIYNFDSLSPSWWRTLKRF